MPKAIRVEKMHRKNNTDNILSMSPSKRDVVIWDLITLSSNALKYYKRKLVTPQFSHEKKKDQLLPGGPKNEI